MPKKQRRDLTGERFGRLVVIRPEEDHIDPSGRKRHMWLCRCDCGNTKVINGESLMCGYTKSCGCYQRERTSDASTIHGGRDSRLYAVWNSMKSRCFNKKNKAYYRYGGKGITVCDEWLDFEVFRAWSLKNGYDPNAPRGMCTIDRIDNSKGYYPENCRWASSKTQMSNVSYNRIIEKDGETHTIAEWADLYNIPYDRLYQRLMRGWDLETAATKPPRKIKSKKQ